MNEWTKEATEAFIRHIPRDNVKCEKTVEDSTAMKELKRLFAEMSYKNSYERIKDIYPISEYQPSAELTEHKLEDEPIKVYPTGGLVESKDEVPAMLDGDYVINRKQAEKYYGELKKMNDKFEYAKVDETVVRGQVANTVIVDEVAKPAEVLIECHDLKNGGTVVKSIVVEKVKEKVLVFPTKILKDNPHHFFTGFKLCREGTHPQPKNQPDTPSSPTDSRYDVVTESEKNIPFECEPAPFLHTDEFLSSLTYMDRDEAETNEDFLQLIPYCVFKCGKNFLIYRRTKKGGESRLHDKWSLGVGGHLNPCDGEPNVSYDAGMLRELKEEVDFDLTQGSVKNEVLGYIYDDSNAVGRVHFGVVHLIEVDNDAVLNFKDEALDKGSWVGYDWLLENASWFENWSQLTIEYLG